MITISPAEETAAAVRSPDMAEAMVSPAKTRRMIKRTTMPRGVLIMLIMEPEALGKYQHLLQRLTYQEMEN